MLVGVPQWLAEITLLRFCNRMHLVYQWTGTLYTVWGFTVLMRHPGLLNRLEAIVYPLAYGAFCMLLINKDQWQYMQFQFLGREIGGLLVLLSILAFVSALMLAAFRKRWLLSALLILIMVICGATVNPVERGIGAVTNHPISAAVSEISAQEPESCWLCTDSSFLLSNYLMANGARVLDASNFYPDREKWAIIDPDGLYEEATNRYVNYYVVLTEGENSVELTYDDLITLRLNPDTLGELGIRYLLSPHDYTELLTRYGIACEYVTGQDGNGIYRLSYD